MGSASNKVLLQIMGSRFKDKEVHKKGFDNTDYINLCSNDTNCLRLKLKYLLHHFKSDKYRPIPCIAKINPFF